MDKLRLSASSLPGIAREDGRERPFARQSIAFRVEFFLMDARVKPAHDNRV
jgi:hypothetical protein